MRRRDFVSFPGGAAAWVATARAQELRRAVGVVGGAPIPGSEAAVIQRLKVAGCVEGENTSIERRWVSRCHARIVKTR